MNLIFSICYACDNLKEQAMLINTTFALKNLQFSNIYLNHLTFDYIELKVPNKLQGLFISIENMQT